MAEIITSEIEIQSGVISSGLTVETGGVVTVLSGGIVTDAEAVNYGWFWVEEGGHISNIHLTHSGDAMVDGGSAENLTMESAGQVDIFAGTLRNGTIRDKGFGVIYTGGSAFDVLVSAGGRYLINGGYAENTVVSSGGSFTVQITGGLADKTTIEAGGHARITSDGQMWETILNGGRLDVISGRILATTLNAGELHVSSGGPELASGYAENTVVNAGAFIVSGATATDTTLNGGEFIVSGGAVQKTTVKGGSFIATDAEVQSTTVSGGDFIASDAEVQSTTVSGGAVQFIGGTADKTDIFSGSVLVSGGTVQNTTLGRSTGGSIVIPIIGPTFTPFDPHNPIILNPINWDDIILTPVGGTATITYGTGGSILLDGGATVYTPEQRETIGYAGYPGQTVNGDEASAGEEEPACRLDILNGGLAVSTTVNSGGEMRICDGATASNTTVTNGGMVLVSGGGTAHTVTMSSGGGGYIIIPANIVGDVGDNLATGAGDITITPTAISSAPVMTVFEGGLAVSATVSAGLLTLDGGTANNVTLAGGTFHVSSGGIANTMTMTGGTATVFNGGRITGATVTVGTVRFMEGGTLSGAFTVTANADVYMESGSVIAFDITGMTPGAEAESSGLYYIWGAPSFTLTISDIQAAGVYALSKEAAGFRDAITVQSQLGVQLGTLTVGNTAFLNDQYYTLRVTDNVLNLTVSNEAPARMWDPVMVFVNDAWASLPEGSTVEPVAGISATIGVDAFVTGRDATNAVAGNGTVVVAGGEASFQYGITRDTAAWYGASVTGSTVLRNGALTLYSGSTGNDLTVTRDGKLFVNSGATGSTLNVVSGGDLAVSGVARNIKVQKGGTLTVKSGGVCSDVDISASGTLIVEAGGYLTGTGIFATGATIIVNGTINFDLTCISPDTSEISNFDENSALFAGQDRNTKITGSPNFTITVSDLQAAGKYTLISNLDGEWIGGPYTLLNVSGEAIGTLTAGSGLFIDGRVYKLDTVMIFELNPLSYRTVGVTLTITDWAETNILYVNTDWAVLEPGAVVDVSTVPFQDRPAIIGFDAFGDLKSAEEHLTEDGFIIIKGGTYASETISVGITMEGGTIGDSVITETGSLTLNHSSSAMNLTVDGALVMNSSAKASDLTVSGRLVMNDSSEAESITVTGNLVLNGNSKVKNLTANEGAVVRSANGNAKLLGAITIGSGATLTGTAEFGENSELAIDGTWDFDISGSTTGNEALFRAEGTPVTFNGTTAQLVITVSDTQDFGVYKLASGITGFDDAFFTIVNTTGTTVATLAVGEDITIDGKYYRLTCTADTAELTLTVRKEAGLKIAYVNSKWANLEFGTVVLVPGGTAVIGKDAFASIAPAEEEISFNGTITIVGGSYSSEYLTRKVIVQSGTLSNCGIASDASLVLNRGAVAQNLSVQGTLIVDEGATLSYSGSEDWAFGSESTIIVNGTFEFDISDVVSTLQTEDIKFSGLDSIYGRPQYVFVDDSESLPLVEGMVPGAVTPFTQMMETVSSFYYTLPIGIDQLLNLDRTLSIKRNGKVYKIKNNGYVISTSPSEAQPKGTTTDQGLALFSGMAFIDSRYYKINILNAENGGICITFTVNKFNTNDVYLNSDWSNKFYHDVVHLVSGGTASYLNNAFDDADYAVEVSKKHKLTIEGGTYSFSGKNLQASQVVVKAGVVILDVLLDPDRDCEVILESGATGIDLTVKRLEVKDGAVCKNITVRNSCTLDLKSGGVLTGTGSFASGSYVTIDGTLVFDVIGLTPADQPLYSGLKYIKGTPTFTLSVGSAQECGLYVLASETGGFDDTISVTDESGVPAGSLAVGDTVLIGDRYYTLHTMNDRLTLSVSTEEPDPLPAVVTVNAAWAGYEAGQPVILADGSTVLIGYNAFADLNTAYNFLSDDGVAIVVGGTFTPEYGIIRKTVAGNGVLIVNATVEKHGCLTVENGATAESITVLGTLSLSGGGVMAGTITVKNGGVLVLEKDAVQNGTIALTGGTLRLAGYELAELVNPEGFPNTGDITGTGKFKAGANIRIEHLYFDLSGEAPDAAPLFEGISAVMKDRNVGNGFLTVQVGDDQSAGTYYLATDAADTQTVRVKCHDEVLVYNLGISDGPVRIGDRSYRLILTESNDLYFTIRDYEPADTVYINTTWADLPAEEIVTLVGGGTAVIGVDAFTTIEAGRKALRENGTLVLDGGTFEKLTSGDIGFSNETVVAMSGSTLCVTVESGGSLTLESGAACNQIKVRDNGTLLVKEGAELNVISTGWKIAATFEEGASVTIDGMVNFIFDMSKGNLDLLIDGYSRIQGSPTYRVLLQGPVQLPAYSNGNKKSTVRLFTNVSGFTDSIVIVDSNGVELGTVSTDSYLKIDDEYYAFLSYTGLYVSLTIANYLSLQEVHFNTDWAGLEDGTDVVLADGSTVTIGINAFSDLETAFGAAENTILIEGGSVYFAPDALFLDKVKAFVTNEGTVVSGLLQVHYDPKIYYGQPAFDHLTMKQGSLLKDAEIQTGLVYMEGGSGMEGTILVENSTLTARNGIITIGGDADVTFVNSRIEITVKGFDPGENAVIEGASRIKGAPIIYCTVGRDDQTLGTYRIIGDAAGIETIILSFENYYSPPGNGTGIDVSLSDPLGVTKDGRTYKLSLDQNNDLFLTISDYVLPETFYIGAEWSELTDGTVVEVPGGSAVIGLDAFADMQSISPLITVDTELVFVSGSYSFLKSYTRKLVITGQAVAYDSTLTAGSTLTLRQNGKAYNVVVSENSTLVLEAGAETRDLSVLGSLSVGDGTLAGNLQVYAGGTLTVEAGAKFTGWGVFEEGATITVNGTLDFDISGSAAGGSALYKGLRYVQGDTFYTLTVGTEQTDGFYYLATGADGFNATVTLTGIDGTVLGTLKVGTSARIYGMVYTLNLGDGILSLTVAAASGTDTRSDVDGNGVSDVLFQYTGGDNQTGYWLNGKDTWRSSNCAHPVEWTLLGAYDMDGDGLADSVFVGNGVVVDGVKGAYIGYYKRGIDTDENWVNIDFLENEEDNAWVNKIGNLTGNPGMNSIVWHCASLGAIGVWTDGTSEWTQLGIGFDANWTLVGCGDFNGDGRDSIVMSYLDGTKYYAIDIDGSAVDMGALNWTGWEVRAIGDFAGDGKDDMILFHKDYGAVVMIADGNLDNYTAIGQLDAKDWFIVGAGDYDGDAKDDLLVRQYSTGMLGYYSACDTSKWVEMGRGVDMDWTVIA